MLMSRSDAAQVNLSDDIETNMNEYEYVVILRYKAWTALINHVN